MNREVLIKVHNFYHTNRRYPGHDVAVTHVNDRVISGVGWSMGSHISKGDCLLIGNNDGDAVLYRVSEIDYKLNPPEMFSFEGEFLPGSNVVFVSGEFTDSEHFIREIGGDE